MSTTTNGGSSPRHLRSDPRDVAPRRGRTVPAPPGRSIRSRLLLILAVPTAALMIVAAVAIASQMESYREADATASGTRLTLIAQGLVHELQRERGLSNGLLGGQQQYETALGQQRRRADAARTELDAALDATSAASAAPLRGALQKLGDQRRVRTEVDLRSADQARTLAFYTDAIVALNDAGATDGGAISDAGLRVGLDAQRTLGEAKEATALERGFLNGVFSANSFRNREYARFSEIRGRRLAGLNAFSRQATPSQQAALDKALASPDAQAAQGLEQRAVDGPTAPALGVAAPQWWDAMTVLVDDMRAVQQQVGGDVEARATALRSRALTVLLLVLALGLAVAAIAIALAVVAARSITRPLQLVASEATRLPETVARIQAADGAGAEPAATPAVQDLQSHGGEIGEVARALSQVQRTALRLATEQAQLRRTTAESLASLGRRNQNLLRRLLVFVSQLERDENDPAALANLFEIDHLATRMRRNAESLLILVGERSPRQGSRPVPISDVVRAALSEIEEYRRVALHRLEDTRVVGSSGAELAHLVAELLENALSFSPPDRDVEVYGRHVGADYVLAVLDHGIGMSSEDLAMANGRLAGEEIFDVAPTRYLGHYVVGQLANRLQVRVRLHESPLTGVTAKITLPAAMLVVTPAVPAAPTVPSTPAVTAPPAVAAVVTGPTPSSDEDLWNGHAPVLLSTGRPLPSRRSPDGEAVAVMERTPQAPPPAAAARTRNGLVKRVRSTPPGDATPGGAPAPAPRAAPEQRSEPPRPRPAADVRTSLNGFRAGFERREHERGGSAPDAAGGEPRDDPQ